jgi:RNA polymerase sigma-70 factor (ECF subfamily)
MSATPDLDAELMLRVKTGDVAAFETLVEKYKQPVVNLVARTISDLTEAEDLAQNVFVQAYKSAGRYAASAKFSTWLFTIARNLCLNELRRRSRHPADSLDAPVGGEEDTPARQLPDSRAEGPAEALLQGELLAKIEEALADLPESQRTALLLFREKDMAYEDIAEVMGTSLSATKSLIHRARETMKLRLKPYLRSGNWTSEIEEDRAT